MKYSYYFIITIVAFSLSACIKDDFKPLVDYSKSNLDNTVPFSDSIKTYFEGVYSLQSGDESFGKQFVGKWKSGMFCIFSEKEGRYMNLEVGFNPSDSSFRMSGLWRSPSHVEQGQMEFTIAKDEGAKSLFKHQNQDVVLRGVMDGKPIVLAFKRNFTAAVLAKNYLIMAHRGGGRNSDNLPYAENSIKLVKYAERLGAVGIEIDIRLTKDKFAVIYHDGDINTRLTEKSPLVGDIHHFTFNQIRSYIKLVDGQQIPTLEEMLTTAIDSTELGNVWLDCKDGGEDSFFSVVVPIVKKAIDHAAAKGRNVNIVFGLPTEEAYEHFINFPDHLNLPSLCELSLDKAKTAGSKVFAPRWTLGYLEPETIDAHANNIRIVTWTLDDPEGMHSVITETEYDGVLSNYPSMLTYEYYSQE